MHSADHSSKEEAIRLEMAAHDAFSREDLTKAEPLFREAVKLSEEIYGHSHFFICNALLGLAETLEAQGETRDKKQEAKGIRERISQILLEEAERRREGN